MGLIALPSSKKSVKVLQREAASLANDGSYFAEQVFPSVTGLDVSANGKILRGALGNNYGDKNANHIRAHGAKYHQQKGLRFDSVDYVVRQYASSFKLAEEDQEEEYSDIELKSEHMHQLVSDLLIRRDRDTADFMTDTSTNGWGTVDMSLSPGDQFNSSSSNPIEVLISGWEEIAKYKMPNLLSLGWSVVRRLRTNDYLLERGAKDRNQQSLSHSELKQLLSDKLDIPIDGIEFARTHANTAALGQTESISPVFDKHVFMGYRATSKADTYTTKFGSVRTANSCARRIRTKDVSVREYFDETTDSIVVKAKWSETLVAVNGELGYLFKDAVA